MIRCAGSETISALMDGQEVMLKKKLHRGHLVASGSAGEARKRKYVSQDRMYSCVG